MLVESYLCGIVVLGESWAVVVKLVKVLGYLAELVSQINILTSMGFLKVTGDQRL